MKDVPIAAHTFITGESELSKLLNRSSCSIWFFTGLFGAGKSIIADSLEHRFRAFPQQLHVRQYLFHARLITSRGGIS